MTDPHLLHAASRYHASYGGTSLTRAFLELSNLEALVQSFQVQLTALYVNHELPPPQLVIDESWVLELFAFLHKTRHLHRSVAEANAGFQHQFFKPLSALIYDQTRLSRTLARKAAIPVRYRQYYSADTVAHPQLAIRAEPTASRPGASRHNASMEQRTFEPIRNITPYARSL